MYKDCFQWLMVRAKKMNYESRYASVRAIEIPSPMDDQQWLTYWVIYSFTSLFGLSCWKVLQWYHILCSLDQDKKSIIC